jgi:hypothetical protein
MPSPEVGLDGGLPLRGEGLQDLFGVDAGLLHQSLCGCNDFDGNLSLDHLRFESLNDVLEDLGGFLRDGWVRSALLDQYQIVKGMLGRKGTYWSISCARNE